MRFCVLPAYSTAGCPSPVVSCGKPLSRACRCCCESTLMRAKFLTHRLQSLNAHQTQMTASAVATNTTELTLQLLVDIRSFYSQGWSLLKSAAVNASIHILRRAYALNPCQQTPVSLLTDSSISLTPTNCAFFVRILRDQAAILSAPHVYPEPPELAGVLHALRRSEVGGKRGWMFAMYDEVVCR